VVTVLLILLGLKAAVVVVDIQMRERMEHLVVEALEIHQVVLLVVLLDIKQIVQHLHLYKVILEVMVAQELQTMVEVEAVVLVKQEQRCQITLQKQEKVEMENNQV